MSLPKMSRVNWRARAVTESPAPRARVTNGPADLKGSVQLRHVDAGSCNGCELEIVSAFGPVYDAERFGARLVASPATRMACSSPGPSPRTWSFLS